METTAKKPRGRKGGMKPKETWEQRYESDPAGTTPVLVSIPHELGRRLEWMAKEEDTTVAKLLTRFAENAMAEKLVV